MKMDDLWIGGQGRGIRASVPGPWHPGAWEGLGPIYLAVARPGVVLAPGGRQGREGPRQGPLGFFRVRKNAGSSTPALAAYSGRACSPPLVPVFIFYFPGRAFDSGRLGINPGPGLSNRLAPATAGSSQQPLSRPGLFPPVAPARRPPVRPHSS